MLDRIEKQHNLGEQELLWDIKVFIGTHNLEIEERQKNDQLIDDFDSVFPKEESKVVPSKGKPQPKVKKEIIEPVSKVNRQKELEEISDDDQEFNHLDELS